MRVPASARRCLAGALLSVLLAIGPAASAQPSAPGGVAFAAEPLGVREALGLELLVFAPDTDERSPAGALRRSLILPGWGQAYNREWVKVPVVVGGLGALGYAVGFSQHRTVLFRRAAIFADCQTAPGSVPPGTCDDVERFARAFAQADARTPGSLTGPQARTQRDAYRRQRDLLSLVTLLAYGLQALDAYVAAELADFDVGEDLSLRVGPSVEASLDGSLLVLRWRW